MKLLSTTTTLVSLVALAYNVAASEPPSKVHIVGTRRDIAQETPSIITVQIHPKIKPTPHVSTAEGFGNNMRWMKHANVVYLADGYGICYQCGPLCNVDDPTANRLCAKSGKFGCPKGSLWCYRCAQDPWATMRKLYDGPGDADHCRSDQWPDDSELAQFLQSYPLYSFQPPAPEVSPQPGTIGADGIVEPWEVQRLPMTRALKKKLKEVAKETGQDAQSLYENMP